MHVESERELGVRQRQYQKDVTAVPEALDLAEMVPHIEALQLSGSESLLEIGAGSGRYTAQLASQCSSIVAVDFSREGLTQMVRRLAGHPHVIPVQADIKDLRVAPESFDRALCTLTSNLPTRELRAVMFRLAYDALKPGGIFVFGMHYWGPAARRQGLLKDGRYDNGIYRYYMTEEEARAEASAVFQQITVRPVQIILPGTYRFRLPLYPISRMAERLPVLRNLGWLLMGVARKPAHV
jgi:SAM-dependent methyltransferase